MLTKLKPQLIFYILLTYVLIQFSWWAYMLVDLNHEVINLNQSNYSSTSEIEKAISKRTWMIIGEGLVFLILLNTGAFLTLRTFKKEVNLSKQQKNFLLSATHELKTPIASIKLMLETFQKRELSREQQKPLVNNALSETERLNTLIENMMLASQFENKQFQFDHTIINISELTEDIVKRFKVNYPNISTDIDENISISSNTHAFSSILYNLIDNAIKYSNNGNITIKLTSSTNKPTLIVADEGIGIPQNELKNVFKRFYRIGNEATRSSKGTGLGLYIVKQLIDFHHASIEIKSNSPKGTIFAIKF